EASRIAVDTIMTQLSIHETSDEAKIDIPADELSSAVKAANLSIMQEAIEHPRQRGMGTTLTMVFVRENVARFAHVGDSRAYLVDVDGHIEQITSDHSFVQALLDAGHITEEQAEAHPMSNVLYRALGQTRDLDVDTYSAGLANGDTLVLCSDGLTRHVRSTEIAEMATWEDPQEISKSLVDLANSRGGEDNISVIVVRVEGDSSIARQIFIDEASLPVDDGDTLKLPNRPQPPSDENPQDLRASIDMQRPERRESYDNSDRSESTISGSGRFDAYNPEGPDRSFPR
ncbi:MAG: protein phosphatase 2C domain-containing protein, partial [Chloroflexota bacterium]